MNELRVEVAIIGTGTAGMSAYRAATAHTDSVVLIESGHYGTTCARVGCMPSKLLIAAAEAAHHARHGAAFGVHVEGLRIDGAEVLARVRRERDRFVGFVTRTVDAWPQAHRVRGEARFVGPNTLQVGEQRIWADRIVIATGSQTRFPSGWRDRIGDRLIGNDEVFEWADLPASVAVIGSGAIGLELAQALTRLGVAVSLFERGGRFGGLSDPVVAQAARRILVREIDLRRIDALQLPERIGDRVRLHWTFDGGAHQAEFDYVLSAMGREPNVQSLDLAAAGIALDAKGLPASDDHSLRIGQSAIYIAGDVRGERALLHEAADEGRIAGDNAGRGQDQPGHRRTPLAIVFTDPQIAVVGRSYAELVRDGAGFVTGSIDFGDQGRSRVMNRHAGLLHVYAERGSGRLLGAELIAPAGEHLAHELAIALHAGLDVDGLLAAPFYHPVIEEGLRSALREARTQLLQADEGELA